jgi:hypothetical protein
MIWFLNEHFDLSDGPLHFVFTIQLIFQALQCSHIYYKLVEEFDAGDCFDFDGF